MAAPDWEACTSVSSIRSYEHDQSPRRAAASNFNSYWDIPFRAAGDGGRATGGRPRRGMAWQEMVDLMGTQTSTGRAPVRGPQQNDRTTGELLWERIRYGSHPPGGIPSAVRLLRLELARDRRPEHVFAYFGDREGCTATTSTAASSGRGTWARCGDSCNSAKAHRSSCATVGCRIVKAESRGRLVHCVFDRETGARRSGAPRATKLRRGRHRSLSNTQDALRRSSPQPAPCAATTTTQAR